MSGAGSRSASTAAYSRRLEGVGASHGASSTAPNREASTPRSPAKVARGGDEDRALAAGGLLHQRQGLGEELLDRAGARGGVGGGREQGAQLVVGGQQRQPVAGLARRVAGVARVQGQAGGGHDAGGQAREGLPQVRAPAAPAAGCRPARRCRCAPTGAASCPASAAGPAGRRRSGRSGRWRCPGRRRAAPTGRARPRRRRAGRPGPTSGPARRRRPGACVAAARCRRRRRGRGCCRPPVVLPAGRRRRARGSPGRSPR